MLCFSMPYLDAVRSAEGQGWMGDWSPGIGDPSAVGWITVALYLLAAWVCLQSARWSRAADPNAPPGDRETRVWTVFAAVLLALGINKQLDLQTALAEVLQGLARGEGWYEARRQYQFAFIVALVLLAVSGGVALLAFTRRLDHTVKLAAFGMVFLLAFVVARAASFHHVGDLLRGRILRLRVTSMLEIGGIGILITAGAFRRRRLIDLGKPLPLASSQTSSSNDRAGGGGSP
jgi:hypothetical protein